MLKSFYILTQEEIYFTAINELFFVEIPLYKKYRMSLNIC